MAINMALLRRVAISTESSLRLRWQSLRLQFPASSTSFPTSSSRRDLSKFLHQVSSTSMCTNSTNIRSYFRHPACWTSFHTSSSRLDLSEFLDNEKNWAEENVKVGRPWKLDELRIKSNEDLHKLWYILLKERNMLLTMEAEYKRQTQLFPSPERIDKVDESMENLLAVVRERNHAYNLLETGETGEPGGEYVRNFLGLQKYRKFKEHLIPKHMNKTYKLLHPPYRKSMVKYIWLHRAQQRKRRLKEIRKNRNQWNKLVQKFPHLASQS